MQYEKKVKLKDNRTCLIRNGNEKDALVMLNMYIDVHNETDYLLAYGDECTLTEETEARFLKMMSENNSYWRLLMENLQAVLV